VTVKKRKSGGKHVAPRFGIYLPADRKAAWEAQAKVMGVSLKAWITGAADERLREEREFFDNLEAEGVRGPMLRPSSRR
jgi:hypothetical protein